MRFKVYLLRSRGRRLAFRDVLDGPKYTGDLISEQVTLGSERFGLVSLRCDDPMVPSPGVFGVVQEWHCELT